MRKKLYGSILIATLLMVCIAAKYDESMQAAKMSLFVWQDPEYSSAGLQSKKYTLSFKNEFKQSPKVALGLYTLDCQYSAYFLLELFNVTTSSMTASIVNMGKNKLNQIYVMYFGTDYYNFEVALLRFDTENLDESPGAMSEVRLKRSETREYNFDRDTRQHNDTYITLYLAGINIIGENTNSKFKENFTDFSITAQPIPDGNTSSTKKFMVTILTSGEVAIPSVQFFYVAYEKTKIESEGRFILNSGKANATSFGATVSESYRYASVDHLENSLFIKTEAFFFGLNDLRSRNDYLRILGVEQIAGQQQNQSFSLVVQTWQSTYIEYVAFSYLQIKKIRCNKDPYLAEGIITCPDKCPNQYYMDKDTCLPCHYSCLTCNDGNLCQTCAPKTRRLNGTCLCAQGFYETLQVSCSQCPAHCLQCQSPTVCVSCRPELNRYLNPVSRYCDCQFGYTSMSNATLCKPCVVGCSNCTDSSTCSSCYFGFLWVNSTFCARICKKGQAYDYPTNNCRQQAGYTGFEYTWDYAFNGTDLLLNVYMTKPMAAYYYFQGGNGFNYQGMKIVGNGQGLSPAGRNGLSSAYGEGSTFYDDGNGFYEGYSYASTIHSGEGGANKINGVPVNPSVPLIGTNTATENSGNSGSPGSSSTLNTSSFSSETTTTSNRTTTTNTTSTTTTTSSTSTTEQKNIWGTSNVQTKVYNSTQSAQQSMAITNMSDLSAGTVVSRNGSTLTLRRTTINAGVVTVQTFTIPSNMTSYYYMNTGQVNRYKIEGQPENANFADAFNQNVEFRIDGDLVPTRAFATSDSTFSIIAKPAKSYINGKGVLGIRDQALAVHNKVLAIQNNLEPINIDRYDYYSLQQIQQSNALLDSNRHIVQVLWGISKMLLFLGMGWPVMPLMLSMQYIFAHSYLSTKLPLNLEYFLKSFKDYRNPSLLFPEARDEVDKGIFPPVNSIYKVVPEYNVHDRGIDFLHNSFQLLLTCGLSFALLALLYLVSLLILASSDHAVSPISDFFWGRKLIHAGSYGLLSSLPLSYYFFGQMMDTTPAKMFQDYSNFNILIAIIAFMGLLCLPIILYSAIFAKYNYNRISQVQEGVQMMVLLKNTLQKEPQAATLTQYNDPLWSVASDNTMGYLWAACLYYKLILFGWCLSFFGGRPTFQLIGIIAINTIFLFYTLFSSFFQTKLYKLYFASQLLLMLAFELLIAGISSQKGLSTEGLLNFGYFGICLIYLMLIPALLMSLWRMWDFLKHLFINYFARGKFLVLRPSTIDDINMLTNKRDRALTGRKSTILEAKRLNSRIGSQYHRSHMVPGSQMLFRYGDQEDRITERTFVDQQSRSNNGILKKSNVIMQLPNYMMDQNSNYQVEMVNQPNQYDQFSNLHDNTNVSADNPQLRLNTFNAAAYANDTANLSVNSKAGLKLRGMKQMMEMESFEQPNKVSNNLRLKTQYEQAGMRQKNRLKTSTVHFAVDNSEIENDSELVSAEGDLEVVQASQQGGRNIIKLRSRSNPSKAVIMKNVSSQAYNKLKLKKGLVLLNRRNQITVDGVVQNCQTQFIVDSTNQFNRRAAALWKVTDNVILLQLESGQLLMMDRAKNQHLLTSLMNTGNQISVDENRVYINGQDVAQYEDTSNLPVGTHRLLYSHIEDEDVILNNLSDAQVVRLQSLTHPGVLQQLQDHQNIITTDGAALYINGVDVQQIQDAAEGMSQQFASETIMGRNTQTTHTTVVTTHHVVQTQEVDDDGQYQVGAIKPENFDLNAAAMAKAVWVSHPVLGTSGLMDALDMASISYPGFKYLIKRIDTNEYFQQG